MGSPTRLRPLTGTPEGPGRADNHGDGFRDDGWPAAVAAALQVALLLATTSTAGPAEALLVASCATGTITACRLNRAD